MGSARSHPGFTSAIAVLAAGTLVASPLATPLATPRPDVAVPVIDLIASPLDPYIDLITNTFTNLGIIGAHWFEDPLPTVVQLFANGFDYIQATFDALGATVSSFIDGMINLPGQFETLIDAISSSDIVGAVAQVIIIVLSAFPVLGLVDRLLAIPIEVVGNIVSAAEAVLHTVQVPVGLSVFTAAQATFAEVETVARDIFDDLSQGDIGGALVGLIGAPAQLLDALLNGDNPGMAGLLAPFQDVYQTGFVDALVNYLPRAVAEAIGAAYSPIDGALPADLETLDVGVVELGEPSALLSDF